MAGIYKAYDIRGTYPDQLNEQIAEDVGRAFRVLLDTVEPGHGGEVAVSRDMRSHSVPLAEALTRGLRDAGLDVVDIGLASTPMSYFAVGRLGMAGGIQVTASHNPARYNGLKFSLQEARPVSGDDGIPLLERLVVSGELPAGEGPGSLRTTEIFDRYGDHLLGLLRRPENSRKLRVVADAANGMGTLYRPLLERAGIDLIPLYFELDGTFPNHEANPLKLENLADLRSAVREHEADLGVAFDGDADRAAFVDERAEPIGSDLMTALIGGEKLSRHPGAAVVYDVRSSRAVPEYLEERGGVPVRERVGHSFIKATMRKRDAVFGGELAGHYYFRENYFADCSLLAVFDVLSILWAAGAPLSEVVAPLRRYAKSEEINFEVEDKSSAMADLEERYGAGEIDRIDGIRIDFDDWWFNVRPSNTEPLLRLVLEADTPELLAEKQAELVGLLGEPV
ncbi:MAG TPA: phosphomannomutase/phosphoglucomutase [Thermoanaerobaculia bacterium]|nr:phosphomannomutase/phosphoglucomutase [Thermoanaerobaculia bacterium]